MKLNRLFVYNEQLFDALKREEQHLQIGFFSGKDILFIGQNPGAVYNTRTSTLTEKVSKKKDWQTSQTAYKRMMHSTLIGKYVASVYGNDWSKISFTNAVKVATENNKLPSKKQKEFYTPILLDQIELLQPKVIVCLGKYAGSIFQLSAFYVPKAWKKSIVCMVPHPSYVLRQRMNKLVDNQAKTAAAIKKLQKLRITRETTKQL